VEIVRMRAPCVALSDVGDRIENAIVEAELRGVIETLADPGKMRLRVTEEEEEKDGRNGR
jgi:hypothetical protein